MVRPTGSLVIVALAAMAMAGRIQAQVLELSGGSSTLYQAEGGALLLRTSNSESGISAGMVAGRFVAGAHIAYQTRRSLLSAGTEELRLNVPTDLFAGDHRLLGLGLGLRSEWRGTSVQAFAGATSTRFDTPLFQGVRADQPAAAFVLRRRLSSTLSLTAIAALGSSFTMLTTIAWKPQPWLSLAATTGTAGASRYKAVSLDLKRPRLDLKAAYLGFGTSAVRAGNEATLAPEPVHGNVQFTLRSSVRPHFTLSGAHQSSLAPASDIAQPPALSTVDQLSASAMATRGGLNATLLRSTYLGQSNLAYAISASLAATERVHLQTSYFGSRLLHTDAPSGNGSLVTTAQEVLSPRLTVSETITRSAGQTSVSFGGSLLSNLASISADYQTFYIPTRLQNPFQQTLVLDLQLHLFGRLTLHAGTFVSPSGKLLYTTDANAVGSRVPVARTAGRSGFGGTTLRGRVLDTDGNPIAGAAIEVNGTMLFSDSNGDFFLRERHARTYRYAIIMDEFLEPHSYRIFYKPPVLTSIKGPHPPVLIVLERVP